MHQLWQGLAGGLAGELGNGVKMGKNEFPHNNAMLKISFVCIHVINQFQIAILCGNSVLSYF
jgi:hypothetical protein